MKRTNRKQSVKQRMVLGEHESQSNPEAELNIAADASDKEGMRNFELAIEKYGGSLRKRFLASGYTSVDQYIDESRGRNAKGELDVPGPFE